MDKKNSIEKYTQDLEMVVNSLTTNTSYTTEIASATLIDIENFISLPLEVNYFSKYNFFLSYSSLTHLKIHIVSALEAVL